MRTFSQRVTAVAGLAAGVAVVLLAATGWRIAGGDGRLGADVLLSSGPTGELGVAPAGPFLRATGLRPGRKVRSALRLRNQTIRLLAIRVRALPDRPDLEPLLRVSVTSGDRTLFLGLLGGLRSWSRPVYLPSAKAAAIRFVVWLPKGLESGWQGRTAYVPIELESRPVS